MIASLKEHDINLDFSFVGPLPAAFFLYHQMGLI